MLISRQHKWLFVHLQKTGGLSVRAMLKAHFPDAANFMDLHGHALHARRRLGNEFFQYYSFAFVRNPWDRLVSWYLMFQRELAHGMKGGLRSKAMSHGDDFASFVKYGTDVVRDGYMQRSCAFSQLEYLCNRRGEILVSHIYRFEDFIPECKRLAERLRFTPRKVPRKNHFKHPHYSTFYTPELRDIVAKRFARDIDTFGYTFEEP